MTGTDAGRTDLPSVSVQCELLEPRIFEEARLRRMGHSYAEIGKRLGMDPDRVYADVRKLLETTRARTCEETDAVRQMELERLDAVFSVVLEQALAGDLKAVAPLIRIMERRAKYLGLDAPEKQETQGVVTVYLNPAQEGEL